MFAGSHLSWKKREIVMTPYSKNWEALCDTGEQKVLRWTRRISFGQNNSILGTMIGRLAKLWGQCMNNTDFFTGVIKDCVESMHLGHPLHKSLTAIHKFTINEPTLSMWTKAMIETTKRLKSEASPKEELKRLLVLYKKYKQETLKTKLCLTK